MAGESPGAGYWLASDGNWYAPELHPDVVGAESQGSARIFGEAGASAAAEAAKRRLAAEAQLKKADDWSKGAKGERATAEVLAQLPSEFVVFHDLKVPGRTANVDHLVIGPTGVWLIDSKMWQSDLRFGDGTLWHGRFPMRNETRTIEWLASTIGGHIDAAPTPVLCIVGGTLPAPIVPLGDVRAVQLRSLIRLLTVGETVHTPNHVDYVTHLTLQLLGAPELSSSGSLTRGARTPRPVATAVLPVTVEVPATTERAAPPSPGRPVRPPAASAPTRSKGCVAVTLGCAGALVLSLIVFSILGAFVSVINDATDSDPAERRWRPTLVAEAACPAPGAGWTIGFAWPGPLPNLRGYQLTAVSAEGGSLPLGEWVQGTPSPVVPGVAAGTQATFQAVAVYANGTTSEPIQTVFAAPSEPC